MVPPTKQGIKHYFSLQNKTSLLYETIVDITANLKANDP